MPLTRATAFNFLLGFFCMAKSVINPADLEMLHQRLRSVRPDSPRRWGKMNSHQMICHLADSLRVAMDVKQVSPVPGKPKKVLKLLALWLPLPWPPGYPTRPEIDQVAGGGTPPADFERDREELQALMNRLARRPLDFKFGIHPGFGEMSESEWMRWAYLHADHHEAHTSVADAVNSLLVLNEQIAQFLGK